MAANRADRVVKLGTKKTMGWCMIKSLGHDHYGH